MESGTSGNERLKCFFSHRKGAKIAKKSDGSMSVLLGVLRFLAVNQSVRRVYAVGNDRSWSHGNEYGEEAAERRP
jgi:hypothetical protein